MNIIHDSANNRITAEVNGGNAQLSYRRGPKDVYDIYSVVVPTEARGEGVADKLVRKALDLAKAENAKVIPTCPYVNSWFKRHPEEQSILQR